MLQLEALLLPSWEQVLGVQITGILAAQLLSVLPLVLWTVHYRERASGGPGLL